MRIGYLYKGQKGFIYEANGKIHGEVIGDPIAVFAEGDTVEEVTMALKAKIDFWNSRINRFATEFVGI